MVLDMPIPVICLILTGFVYALVGGLVLRPKFYHQEPETRNRNAKRVFLFNTVFFGTIMMILISPILPINMHIFPALLAVFIFAGSIIFFIFLLRTKQWKALNANHATLRFKQAKHYLFAHRTIIVSIDGMPEGRGLVFWAFNRCLIPPGKHRFHFRVVKSLENRTNAEETLFSQEVEVELSEQANYYIEEDEQRQALYFRLQS